MKKLCLIRQTAIFLVILLISTAAKAQLVDGLLGQKRALVQVLLRSYKLVDYQKEREVHIISKGVHQTALFENDTCVRFYWAVNTEHVPDFRNQLAINGYRPNEAGMFVKDSLELIVKPLDSGKATLFIAALSQKLQGKRDAAGRPVVPAKKVMASDNELPLLQQAILAEEADSLSSTKKVRYPEQNWVGTRSGTTTILGWEK